MIIENNIIMMREHTKGKKIGKLKETRCIAYEDVDVINQCSSNCWRHFLPE